MDAPAVTDAQPAPAEREPTLVVLSGARMGLVHTLQSGGAVFGRSPECEVALEDDGISRQHARILVRQGLVEIEDLRSTNGTYVDGSRISTPVRLQDGSRVRMGNVTLKFAWQDRDALRAHKHMYDMSVRDGLTGLFNRRYFDERLEAEHAFAARHRSALCVLLCDIDHFKRVNDQHGHPAGDAVLRAVAAELRDRVRTEDVVARFGGEELAIIARGIDVTGTRMFAERMRGIVEALQITVDDKIIPVTVSIGIAHTHAGPTASRAEGLVVAADTALYAAKRAGRNRALLAESPGRYSVTQDDARQDSAPQALLEPQAAQAPQAPARRPPRERANTAPVNEEAEKGARGVSQARIRRIT